MGESSHRSGGPEGDSAGGVLGLFPGMGRRVAHIPAARAVLEEFAAASRVDIVSLVCDAGERELFADRSWELAVVATEAAALAAFTARGGSLAASLGFSIGAYAALLSAGSAAVSQVVAMIDLVLAGSRALSDRYAMASVTGLSPDEVAAACTQPGAAVAAVIGPAQVLVAGARDAVAALGRALAPRALRTTLLAVRWPLHTPAMQPVAIELERRRAELGGLRAPRHPVYSAVDGGLITTPNECWELLVRHLVRPQRPDLALASAYRDGHRRAVELGPGDTLARAVRWMDRGDTEVEVLLPDERRAGRTRGRC